MTIGQVYTYLLSELKASFTYEEAKTMVFSLLEHHLQISKARVMIQFNREVPDISLPAISRSLDELMAHKPLQYVLGRAWFMNLEFKVNEHVLIPRPETEELVQSIIQDLNTVVVDANFPLKILDIGTGSGCIAVTLKNLFPELMVFGMDNSEEALQLARVNAMNHRADVIFVNSDILVEETWDGLPAFDVIVSNPPYVLENEKKLMQRNVLDFEPAEALYVPDEDPLLYYKAIARFASFNMRPKGFLYLEINENFGDEVKSLYLAHQFEDVRVVKDMSDKDRFVHCRNN